MLLMLASWDAFQNNAISFVVETSYRDWDTNFPAIVICETKNMDRVQEIAEQYASLVLCYIVIKNSFNEYRLWGSDHDFTLEEVLSEITFFRGESYHTIHECFDIPDAEKCITSDFAHYAQMVRSNCTSTVTNCRWNGLPFDCCKHFVPIETELGTCYALNSKQIGCVVFINR